MPSSAKDAIETFLANTNNPDVLRSIITSDATYISLTFNHPDLTAVMPWAGTHENAGPEAIIKTFKQVAEFWEVLDFEPSEVFAEAEGGGRVAVFGSFKYRSRKLGITVESPFAIFAKVNAEHKIKFMQFMEDTLLTTRSFRKSGMWKIESDPQGGSIVIPSEGE